MQWQLRRIPAELACFGLVALVYLVHLFIAGDDRFYFDSFRYWEVSKLFGKNGGFSLLAFDYPNRGYSLPLVYHGLDGVRGALTMGDATAVKVFGALLAATLGVVVAPRLARALFPGAAISWTRVLLLNALLFVYWRDHFGFPLSDFPALLLASVGLLGLLRATTAGYVGAGLGFMLAANMRPAYLPAAAAAIVVAGVLPRQGRKAPRRLSAVGLVLAGVVGASLPQMLINHRYHASWSPVASGSKEISMLQLTQGMLNQKYETYVGPPDGYPRPEVYFLDPATAHVLAAEGLTEITSYRQYAGIASRHPAEMAASWTRHVFNGLDVRYPTPYIRDLGDSSIVLSLLLYTLLFLALLHLLIPDARRALRGIHWVGVAVLASPCLSAIPGAVEPRFFLPLQLIAYMLVCFGPSTRATVLGGSPARRVALAAAYAAFVLGCLTLSSATLAQLEHSGRTLGAAILCCGIRG
jgi:hypothetical protein